MWDRGIFRLFLLFILFLPVQGSAQAKRLTARGTVTDASTGEVLIGAQVAAEGTGMGTQTNAYGFYSLSMPRGEYRLQASHDGYMRLDTTVNLSVNIALDLRLEPISEHLDEVVVNTQERIGTPIASSQMSVATLSARLIRKIPALMGETDPLKALQLLPGVQATAEGSSGFSVRGGGYDQNLIVLDEATVYSASHLMGFFSVFNNDALKDMKLYKGDIPAAYGGRLSSLVEIHSRDGNNQRFSGRGGIGTISSRLTLEGPLARDRASFIVSARRTYADMFLKLSSDKDLRSSQLYFYDLNAKLSWRLGEDDRLFLAGYSGRDKAVASIFGMRFGNATGSLRWNHIYSPRLFSNLTLTASGYDYYLAYDASNSLAVDWRSRMHDYGAKMDFSYHINPRNTLRFGYQLTYHRFSPGEGGGTGENPIYGYISTTRQYALEQALYASGESTFGPVTLRYGVRASLFQNIANGDSVRYRSHYEVTKEGVYPKGTFYNTQGVVEPRLAATWLINPDNSIKAGYTRSAQYIQLASNSTAGSPLDVWFQASQNVRPQLCDQFAVGYFRSLARGRFELSVEAYYKKMSNVIDFCDHAQLLMNKDLETELRFGRGESYGVEVMLSKNTGRLTGWISYDLSRSQRRIDQVNDNQWYRSPYDKPVNISAVVNWEATPRWTLSANWIYATGMPVTYPTGRFQVENTYVPIYSGRNEYRYPDYHRLDVGATWVASKPSRRIQSELNFSIYNAYARKNPWTIIFQHEEGNPDASYGEMIYLFSIVPSVTWNFRF